VRVSTYDDAQLAAVNKVMVGLCTLNQVDP
jgi:hypothetical protein